MCSVCKFFNRGKITRLQNINNWKILKSQSGKFLGVIKFPNDETWDSKALVHVTRLEVGRYQSTCRIPISSRVSTSPARATGCTVIRGEALWYGCWSCSRIPCAFPSSRGVPTILQLLQPRRQLDVSGQWLPYRPRGTGIEGVRIQVDEE